MARIFSGHDVDTNTPLFDNARTKMGVKPVAPPPAYRARVVADAIVHAAQHPVRDLVVGGAAKTLITVEKFAPRLVDALLRRVGYEIHDTGERKPADAPDNLDAPLTANDTVEGTVGGVTLRHSAYTWLAIHKPVRSTVRTLTRPLTRRRRGPSRVAPAATAAARRTFRLTAAGRLTTRQRADHARLDRLMARARDNLETGGVAHQAALRAVARLVFTHAFAEESVQFPAARRVLPEGDPLTLRIETDHQEVDELVTQLDRSSPDDPAHRELMERTFAVLDHDVRTEEDELLPRMQELHGPRRLRLIGWQWELVRRIAPTRPHPVVSRRPPGQVLSALPLTVLDRARDLLQRLDEISHGRFTAPISTADRFLATTAGALERIPVLQRGERSETSRSE